MPNITERRIALIIDSQDMPISHLRPLPEILTKFGTLVKKFAIGEWGTPQTRHHEDYAKMLDVELLELKKFDWLEFDNGFKFDDLTFQRKTLCVIALLTTHGTSNILCDDFAIVCSDPDIIPLLNSLRVKGHKVYLFCRKKNLEDFIGYATEVAYLRE